jgi:hypothetical protein
LLCCRINNQRGTDCFKLKKYKIKIYAFKKRGMRTKHRNPSIEYITGGYRKQETTMMLRYGASMVMASNENMLMKIHGYLTQEHQLT